MPRVNGPRQSRGPRRLAMQSVKEVQREIECVPLEQAFHKMRTDPMPVYRKMLKSADAKEGVAAFMDKREPNFRGRMMYPDPGSVTRVTSLGAGPNWRWLELRISWRVAMT